MLKSCSRHHHHDTEDNEKAAEIVLCKTILGVSTFLIVRSAMPGNHSQRLLLVPAGWGRLLHKDSCAYMVIGIIINKNYYSGFLINGCLSWDKFVYISTRIFKSVNLDLKINDSYPDAEKENDSVKKKTKKKQSLAHVLFFICMLNCRQPFPCLLLCGEGLLADTK